MNIVFAILIIITINHSMIFKKISKKIAISLSAILVVVATVFTVAMLLSQKVPDPIYVNNEEVVQNGNYYDIAVDKVWTVTVYNTYDSNTNIKQISASDFPI